MRSKHILLVGIMALGVMLMSWMQTTATAQEIASENLFTNPGFEQGYFNQNGIPQIAVPNGWTMHWLDNVAFEGTEGVLAYRPETVVWFIQDAPESERPLFFRDGSYTLKVFKGYAPMYAALSQNVSGLEVGRRYRISAPIYVDIVQEYDGGKKVPPYRNDSGFVRFGASSVGAPWRDGSQINYSPFWTADNVQPFYQAQPIFLWDFTATATDMTIWIEMGSRHPYRNNGFFMDGVGLFALNETGSVPAGSGGNGGGAPSQPVTPPTPFPTPTPSADGSIVHVVNSGDTMWTIAIRYAPALGVTPEQALPIIQELNNNPAFISVGQQLLIQAPTTNAPVTAEEAPADDEASDGEEAEPVATGEPIQEPTEEPVEEEESNEVAEAETTDVAVDALSSICVTVFEDVNGDGVRDAASEPLQADAAVTIFRGGTTVSTHIADGSSESHCFTDLENDTYQVQVFPPANYNVTTAQSWAVAVSNGTTIPVSFGVQESVEVAAVVTDSTDTTAAEDTAVESTDAEAEAPAAQSGGFFSSIGGIVLIIAAILVLIAGAGVYMLRRG